MKGWSHLPKSFCSAQVNWESGATSEQAVRLPAAGRGWRQGGWKGRVVGRGVGVCGQSPVHKGAGCSPWSKPGRAVQPSSSWLD